VVLIEQYFSKGEIIYMVLTVKFLKDCWGSHSYFGCKNGSQHTDGFDSLEELIEDYPEFKGMEIIK